MPTPTNLDLARLIDENHRQHEGFLARWDDHVRRSVLERTHPVFVRLAPRLALWLDRNRQKVSELWCGIGSHVRAGVLRRRFERTSNLYLETTRHYSFVGGPSGHLTPDIRTLCRIRDMRALSTNHPWFGAVDMWVYQSAWEAGARWAENNLGKTGMELQGSLASSTGELPLL